MMESEHIRSIADEQVKLNRIKSLQFYYVSISI